MVVDREAITILQNAAHEALKNNLEEILTDARPRLLRQAQRQGLTPDIAEDIAQETLIEAWRSLEHLQTPENLHAWLHGICRNVCLRWWKASNKSGQYVSSPFTTLECWNEENTLDLPDPQMPDLIEALDHQDLAILLDHAMGYLPQSARQEVELCYLQELPVEEVALQMGLAPKTLHVRLHRTRRQLWKILHHELRGETQSLGLILDQDEIVVWQQTRIWCQYCGQQQLEGWLEPYSDNRLYLHLRCSRCHRERVRSGALAELHGMKAFRPAFKRVERIASQAWTQMLQTHTCSFCHAPVQLQTLMPGESLPPHHLSDPTIRIFTKCHWCNSEGMAHIGLLILFHPAVQNFIAQHPRYIYIADQCTEYAGQPAFLTVFADTQSAARLFAWVDVQSLQVLHTKIE